MLVTAPLKAELWCDAKGAGGLVPVLAPKILLLVSEVNICRESPFWILKRKCDVSIESHKY